MFCDSSPPVEIVPYHAMTFVNTGEAGTFAFTLAGYRDLPDLTLRDAFMVVYAGTSIPADVRMCLAANDDYFLGHGSSIHRLPVAAGASVTVIATAFELYLGAGPGYGYGTWSLSVYRNNH